VTGKVIARSTIGGNDYILREVTIPPGQATGWHFHDGPLYAYVKQGTLSHFDSTCESDGVYSRGSSLKEPSGPDHVHIVQNLGTADIVLEVLYVLPHGAPFLLEARLRVRREAIDTVDARIEAVSDALRLLRRAPSASAQAADSEDHCGSPGRQDADDLTDEACQEWAKRSMPC
jgi:quercetin dioxygenase-like cupin family protein